MQVPGVCCVTYMAPREISKLVQEVTRARRVVLATRTKFMAMPICPAVVVPLSSRARVIRIVAIAATRRSRTSPSHCCRQRRV